MEMGESGERIDGEGERITYTVEITDRERERKRCRLGNHGRMHAGNAAHRGCDGLGPVHSERMKDNEWVHARLHSERASEIDGDGRSGRADRRGERTNNFY